MSELEPLANILLTQQGWLAVFVAELRARGVTVTLRGERLRADPWKLLTAADIGTIRANRESLKALVKAEATAEPRATPDPSEPPAGTGEADAPDPAVPEPEPQCPYCRRALAKCVELKATRLDVWQMYEHPEEIERRRKAATAEMYESLRRYGPARY